MTKVILVAIDLGHKAVEAKVLRKARQLADWEGGMLAVLTVVPDLQMSIMGTYFQEEQIHEALEESQRDLHLFIEETVGRDSETKHIIATGTVYEQILKTASELKAELIVMGAHRPDLTDFLVGPNAARVVRHAKCSVLIVRQE